MEHETERLAFPSVPLLADPTRQRSLRNREFERKT
jgi:hypothetical protein